MSGSNKIDQLVEQIEAVLTACGLDLIQAFDIARYNEIAEAHDGLVPLTQFGKSGALALLVGNTKSLWPHFARAFQDTLQLQQSSDPLDNWVEDTVRRSLGQVSRRHALHFSHDTGAGFISMLHLAEASGLAHQGPAHMAVHAEHGPWFGLRALIILDAEPPEASPQRPGPCADCAAPCTKALELALAASGAEKIASAWEIWVKVRDVCPVGRASRYSENQIRYHYTRDARVLYLSDEADNEV